MKTQTNTKDFTIDAAYILPYYRSFPSFIYLKSIAPLYHACVLRSMT